MKEATGELNMTVVTIIAIGAVLAFFTFFWGNIKNKIGETWNKSTTNDTNNTIATPDYIVVPDIFKQ